MPPKNDAPHRHAPPPWDILREKLCRRFDSMSVDSFRALAGGFWGRTLFDSMPDGTPAAIKIILQRFEIPGGRVHTEARIDKVRQEVDALVAVLGARNCVQMLLTRELVLPLPRVVLSSQLSGFDLEQAHFSKNSARQAWRFIKAATHEGMASFIIESADVRNLVLDEHMDMSQNRVYLHAHHGGENQRWVLLNAAGQALSSAANSRGLFIRSVRSLRGGDRKVLDVGMACTEPGPHILNWPQNEPATLNQQWEIQRASDVSADSWRIRPMHDPHRLCLSAPVSTCAYVMERCDGTLVDLMCGRVGADAPPLRRAMVRDIASAIKAVHDRGLTHTDLHLHNIFFKKSRAVLGDFGNVRGTHGVGAVGFSALAANQRGDVARLGLLGLKLLGNSRVENGQYPFPADVRRPWAHAADTNPLAHNEWGILDGGSPSMKGITHVLARCALPDADPDAITTAEGLVKELSLLGVAPLLRRGPLHIRTHDQQRALVMSRGGTTLNLLEPHQRPGAGVCFALATADDGFMTLRGVGAAASSLLASPAHHKNDSDAVVVDRCEGRAREDRQLWRLEHAPSQGENAFFIVSGASSRCLTHDGGGAPTPTLQHGRPIPQGIWFIDALRA